MSSKLNSSYDSKISSNELRNRAKNWFRDEIFIRRCAASLAWCFLLQWIYFEIGVLFVRLISFHKLRDGKVVSPSSTCYISHHLLMATLNAFIALIHIGQYTVKPTVHRSRLKQIIYNIHPKRFLHLMFHGFVGAMIASIFMKLLAVEYSDFFMKCEKDADIECYYSEKHLFILLHGIYSAVWYSIKYFVRNWDYVEIPAVQELKYHVLKEKLCAMFYQTIIDSLKPTMWFYLMYYLLGSPVKQLILNVMGLQESEQPSLTELGGIIDFELFLVSWIVNMLIHLKWKTFLYLFQTFITERCTFLIDAKTREDEKKCLVIGLRCKEFPLFQYLSYMDLCIVAKQSFEIRKQIFSISQPGGHPYHWDTISSACLMEIKSFMSTLNDITGNSSTKYTAMQDGFTQQPATVTPFVTPLLVSSPLQTRRIHNISPLVDTQFDSPAVKFSPWQTSKRSTIDHKGVLKSVPEVPISRLLNAMLGYLQNIHIVKYFTVEQSDAKARSLYAGCQPLILSIEALCHLVSASYQEDKYGVVQQLLPAILSSLVDLQLGIEGQQKGNILPKKHLKDVIPQKEMRLRQKLKYSLTNGIYHIVISFSDHLSNLPLSSECHHHLNRYLQFME